MKRFHFRTALLAALLTVGFLAGTRGARATTVANPVLSAYRVVPRDRAMLQTLVRRFDVEGKSGDGVVVYVPRERASELLAVAPQAELLESDIKDVFRRLERNNPKALAGYHNFDTMQQHLNDIVKAHPDLASVSTYGQSQEGRPLVVLKLTGLTPVKKAATGTTPDKPEILLTGCTHGNEWIATEVVLGLLDALIAGYGTDQRLTSIVDKHVIYFVPVVNPDGYIRQERYSNGVDPNRDYPYPGNENRNPNPCIKAIMDFVDSHHIVASEDYHSFGELMMYPWAYTTQSPPDADRALFEDAAGKMVEQNGYQPGQISQILYIAEGSSADYYYWKHHSLSFGVEIGQEFIPDSSEIPAHVKANSEATWRMIERF